MNTLNVGTRLRLLSSVAILAVTASASLGQQKVEPPLPDDLVATWHKAGGEIGTMWVFGYANVFVGVLRGGSNYTPIRPGEVPAFYFNEWTKGLTVKLPHPRTAFGLYLRTNWDDDLKELAELGNLRMLALTSSQVSGTGLKGLTVLKGLRSLGANSTNVTDQGLKAIADLKELRTLDLSGTQITDAGLKELGRLRHLEALSVGSTEVTDAGLKELLPLDHLEALDLGYTKVTGKGLKELTSIKSLRRLSLIKAQVTDADIAVLAGLQDLVSLDLSGTPVTSAGVSALKKALPGLNVDRHRIDRPSALQQMLERIGSSH